MVKRVTEYDKALENWAGHLFARHMHRGFRRYTTSEYAYVDLYLYELTEAQRATGVFEVKGQYHPYNAYPRVRISTMKWQCIMLFRKYCMLHNGYEVTPFFVLPFVDHTVYTEASNLSTATGCIQRLAGRKVPREDQPNDIEVMWDTPRDIWREIPGGGILQFERDNPTFAGQKKLRT